MCVACELSRPGIVLSTRAPPRVTDFLCVPEPHPGANPEVGQNAPAVTQVPDPSTWVISDGFFVLSIANL